MLANHGILSYSGHRFTFPQLATAIRATYNVSPMFKFFGPTHTAKFVNLSCWMGGVDISDLNVRDYTERHAFSSHARTGIFSYSGHRFTFPQLATAIRATYNVSPMFKFFGPTHTANFLNLSYWIGRVDVSDLNVRDCTEHDVFSSVRRAPYSVTHTHAYGGDEHEPFLSIIGELLASVTAPDGKLTCMDLVHFARKRRMQAQHHSSYFSFCLVDKLLDISSLVPLPWKSVQLHHQTSTNASTKPIRMMSRPSDTAVSTPQRTVLSCARHKDMHVLYCVGNANAGTSAA
ncbi:hypothetical protein A0H81_10160 [Grifola frondosa]|uniref:Heme haloperoxidase family profile domain-containing protein n=1 Tax=Grifola frondosa TaxID=5627 RepID=A0A1C7LXR8_GRIFR|nr:hypothetical protein A0H81_10160 [Grifola frondosa]